jgi:O-succinylbenzoic acid--CoA ligase
MNLFFPNRVYHHKELLPVAHQLLDQPKEWLQEFAQVIIDWHDDRDFMTAQTSGSTGVPKTIKLSKESMTKSALKTGHYFDLPKGTHALAALPYSFIAGKMMVVRSLVLNWNYTIVPPQSNPLAYLEDEIDFAAMTPHQLSTVIRESRWKLGLVKKILLGGAPVGKELMQQIQSIESEVYLGYGMTETITHIAVKRLNGIDLSEKFTALSGVQFSTSKEGTLHIKADHLEKEIYTTDVVELINDREFNWLGRADNVINSGGIKIHPEQVEAKISSVLDQPFFITSRESELYGQEVILLVEGNAIDTLELMDRLSRQLSKKQLPKDIIFVPRFEYTDTGKVKRKETFNKL